ncbi:hypothetical protein LZ554_008475 [Drepanopeziza brunnea f. sp. 'monogermtubi']|nr:hypothetical protein LZ554_008475 [Drepanopeziza brunnea f. sp. 'monogermtubi']
MPSRKTKKSRSPASRLETQQELERMLGYVFKDPKLLQEALQSAGNGVTKIGDNQILDGNKRLAMLGDGILSTVILCNWYHRRDSTRCTGSRDMAQLACNRHLVQCGRNCGLEKYINKHRSFVDGKVPPVTMSAAVEALIGAVFLDSGKRHDAAELAMKGLGVI